MEVRLDMNTMAIILEDEEEVEVLPGGNQGGEGHLRGWSRSGQRSPSLAALTGGEPTPPAPPAPLWTPRRRPGRGSCSNKYYCSESITVSVIIYCFQKMFSERFQLHHGRLASWHALLGWREVVTELAFSTGLIITVSG